MLVFCQTCERIVGNSSSGRPKSLEEGNHFHNISFYFFKMRRWEGGLLAGGGANVAMCSRRKRFSCTYYISCCLEWSYSNYGVVELNMKLFQSTSTLSHSSVCFYE